MADSRHVVLSFPPLPVQPFYLLVETRLGKFVHAIGRVVAIVLRPPHVVSIARLLNLFDKGIHERVHIGINFLIDLY